MDGWMDGWMDVIYVIYVIYVSYAEELSEFCVQMHMTHTYELKVIDSCDALTY